MFKRLSSLIGSAEAAPPWTLFTALLILVAAFASIIMGSTAASLILPSAQFTLLAGWSIAALLALAIAFLNLPRAEQRAALRLTQSPTLPNIFFLLFIGVGLAVALDVILRGLTGAALPEAELMDIDFRVRLYGQSVQPLSWVLIVLFMVVLQPLAEEVVFRGVLMPSLRATLGAWPGFVVTGVLYAGFHMLMYPPPLQESGTAALYGFVTPLIAGLIFGAVRIYTGSTRAAVFTHAAFGLFAVINVLTLVGRA
jgi:membrane protease YdiL (CAAX protease family)